MNFEFAAKINCFLEKLDFESALKIAESELKKIPHTEFHEIIGISLLNQSNDLLNWIEEFYQLATKENPVKALYFETNGFDINTDLWFIDGFTYEKDEGFDENMDGLCNWDMDSQELTNSVFKIEGLEKLQIAFFKTEEKEEKGEWSDENQNARDWCEQLIIVRFMELMRKTHLKAKERNLKWGEIPIYCTRHEYDFIIKSE